ncbi:hypothetical protein EVAR_27556_1 [Eumeta japonica]|uniref:Uncharacterized protein n=1 Tax=Eumeta variegata TaxID=151549 RepID=A0A4C1WB96_EUMVA|nr:hypothetical protein EVAR_27556_1 [Eumeta japonica]
MECPYKSPSLFIALLFLSLLSFVLHRPILIRYPIPTKETGKELLWASKCGRLFRSDDGDGRLALELHSETIYPSCGGIILRCTFTVVKFQSDDGARSAKLPAPSLNSESQSWSKNLSGQFQKAQTQLACIVPLWSSSAKRPAPSSDPESYSWSKCI